MKGCESIESYWPAHQVQHKWICAHGSISDVVYYEQDGTGHNCRVAHAGLSWYMAEMPGCQLCLNVNRNCGIELPHA